MATPLRRCRAEPPSDRERILLALRRARSYNTRPSSVAAKEFFSDVFSGVDGRDKGSGTDGGAEREEKEAEGRGWRTLPRRLGILSERLLAASRLEESEWGGSGLVPGDSLESRRLEFGAAVFASAPGSFLVQFRKLFAAALEARRAAWEGDDEEEEEDCDGMEEDGDGPPRRKSRLDWEEAEVYESLRTLGWLDRKLSRPLGEAVHAAIRSAVESRIQGVYDEDVMLHVVAEWKDGVVAPWVRDVVGDEAYRRDGWGGRLDAAASECFCDVRIGEMFDVVADYPDSLPAVRELRDALERTGLHGRLATELRTALSRRLIHPGAATAQIIDVYVSAIKVLREIDPSDGLLEAVAEPVRSCLRGRADTVRCIVTSLTDEEQAGGDLYEELRRQDAQPLEAARCDSDDEGDTPDYDWVPTPKHRGVLGKGSAGRGGGDILSMLVNIYGSKELFVNEFRVMLAHKLLSNLDFDTDREVHNLELLKLRFGEMSMRSCEIMIKDLDDSKRINSNIHSTLQSRALTQRRKDMEEDRMEEDKEEEIPATPVDAAIVSHIFWPALQRESLTHHPRIKSQLDEFSHEFAKLKNPRRLVWLDQLGTVTLDLEVVEDNDEGEPQVLVREFTCSTLQATLISHFEDRDTWTAAELSDATGATEDVVRKRMGMFVNGRVVHAVRASDGGTTFGLVSLEEAADSAAAEGIEHGADEQHDFEEEEGGGVSTSAQEAEATAAFESYVVGMLKNLGQMPLERIHDMLKMYATGSEHRYDRTPRQLAELLRKMCREERVECGADGMFKLVKK